MYAFYQLWPDYLATVPLIVPARRDSLICEYVECSPVTGQHGFSMLANYGGIGGGFCEPSGAFRLTLCSLVNNKDSVGTSFNHEHVL